MRSPLLAVLLLGCSRITLPILGSEPTPATASAEAPAEAVQTERHAPDLSVLLAEPTAEGLSITHRGTESLRLEVAGQACRTMNPGAELILPNTQQVSIRSCSDGDNAVTVVTLP